MATLVKMSPDTCPMYCETPKKHSPHTNQLKQMARVRARRRGVRNRAKNDARSTRRPLISSAILWAVEEMPSIGRLFL